MTNSNCLEGLRCPKCKQEDALKIEARVIVYVTDEGTEATDDGHYDWDHDSFCHCPECDFDGKLSDFYIKDGE